MAEAHRWEASRGQARWFSKLTVPQYLSLRKSAILDVDHLDRTSVDRALDLGELGDEVSRSAVAHRDAVFQLLETSGARDLIMSARHALAMVTFAIWRLSEHAHLGSKQRVDARYGARSARHRLARMADDVVRELQRRDEERRLRNAEVIARFLDGSMPLVTAFDVAVTGGAVTGVQAILNHAATLQPGMPVMVIPAQPQSGGPKHY